MTVVRFWMGRAFFSSKVYFIVSTLLSMKTVFFFSYERIILCKMHKSILFIDFFQCQSPSRSALCYCSIPQKKVPENSVFSPPVQNKNVLHPCPSWLHNELISRFVCFTTHFQRSVAMKTSKRWTSLSSAEFIDQPHSGLPPSKLQAKVIYCPCQY